MAWRIPDGPSKQTRRRSAAVGAITPPIVSGRVIAWDAIQFEPASVFPKDRPALMNQMPQSPSLVPLRPFGASWLGRAFSIHFNDAEIAAVSLLLGESCNNCSSLVQLCSEISDIAPILC